MSTRVQEEVKTTMAPVVRENRFAFVTPRADIYESENNYTVLAEMPGVSRESLKVELENGHLVIEGKMAEPTASGTLLVEEIYKRNYRRVFRLTDQIDTTGIRAQWRDGILQVTLNKKESSKPREITINYN